MERLQQLEMQLQKWITLSLDTLLHLQMFTLRQLIYFPPI